MKKIILFLLFITLSKTQYSQGLTCDQAIPIFCPPGSNGITIPNSTNTNAPVGPDYGCLATQPNPKFFYFKNTVPGQLTFQLDQMSLNNTQIDVDFICWGPFTDYSSMCSNLSALNISACSYSASASETMTINANSAGMYYVFMITNFSNESGNITINQINGPTTDSTITCPYEISTTITNPICSNLSDGSFTINGVLGGTPPYTYSLNNGVFTNNTFYNGLANGTYSLVVKDANNCTYNTYITLNGPAPIDPIFNINQQICIGSNLVLPNVSNNNIYGSWSPFPNGNQTTTYTFTPNQGMCALTDSVTITVIDLTTFASAKITDCGNNGGFIRVDSIANGTAPYTFSLNGGLYQSNMMFSGLAGGNHVLTVLDANNCIDTSFFNIQHVNPLVINFTEINTNCAPFQNASISATATGGSLPYDYYWVQNSINSTSINVNNPGIYTCVVYDSDQCSIMLSATIDTILPIQVSINSINTHCNLHNGSAIANVSGGVAPYDFRWSNGSQVSLADSLSSGQYIVQVYDANRCNASASININPIDGPMITTINQSNIFCANSNSGTISIEVIGGQAPYTYHWNTGDTTTIITNLAPGFYDVLVKDSLDCAFASTFEILPAVEPGVNFIKAFPDCGLATGSIITQINNGIAPFTYSWNTGQTTQDLTNISAGIYTLNLTDVLGCLYTYTTELPNAMDSLSSIFINVNSITPSDCGNPSSGSIDVSIIGGSPAYTIEWSNGSNQEDAVNLAAGVHRVKVIDNAQCLTTASFYVPSHLQSINFKQELCIVTVDSSNSKNLIIWEKDQTQGVKSYKIYRESSNNNYLAIATIPFNSLSEYYDTITDPEQRSWRYKITAIDSCDIETPYSTPHKTIHLTETADVNGDFNLSWDYYDGGNYNLFYIWRDDPSTGWMLVDSVPSTITNYFDQNAPSLDARYLIEAVLSSSCVSSIKNYDPKNEIYTTVVKSKSNIRNNRQAVGIKNQIYFGLDLVNVYPNPTSGLITVDFNKFDFTKEIVSIEIDNLLGQTLLKENLRKEKTNINLSSFNKGVYLVKISSGKNYFIKKIIVE